jgi:hypothetical protein
MGSSISLSDGSSRPNNTAWLIASIAAMRPMTELILTFLPCRLREEYLGCWGLEMVVYEALPVHSGWMWGRVIVISGAPVTEGERIVLRAPYADDAMGYLGGTKIQ